MLNDTIRFLNDPVTGTAQNIYAVIWRANASATTSIYNTVSGTFVTCNEANWASYAITMTEGCAGTYAAALPLPLQLPARNYHVAVYQRVGGAVNPNADTILGGSEHATGNLNITVLPSVASACVEANDVVVFVISCTTEDGPLTPSSVVVSVEGTGAAVDAAVPGHPSVRKITYTADSGAAGTNDCVVATLTFPFPDALNNYGTVVHKVGVPIFVCESAAAGACPSEVVIAAEVLSVLNTAHGAGSWEGPTEADIAAEVDTVLSVTHGASSWEATTEADIAAEVDTVLTASHGAGGWTTGAGGTGIEISS
jgi:hypothetical protein